MPSVVVLSRVLLVVSIRLQYFVLQGLFASGFIVVKTLNWFYVGLLRKARVFVVVPSSFLISANLSQVN